MLSLSFSDTQISGEASISALLQNCSPNSSLMPSLDLRSPQVHTATILDSWMGLILSPFARVRPPFSSHLQQTWLLMRMFMYLFTLHILNTRIHQRYKDMYKNQDLQIRQSPEGVAVAMRLCTECEGTQRRQLKQTEGWTWVFTRSLPFHSPVLYILTCSSLCQVSWWQDHHLKYNNTISHTQAQHNLPIPLTYIYQIYI